MMLCSCDKKENKESILENYAIDTAIHFCYDTAGYDMDANSYYLVESSNNAKGDFPADYYVLENDKPILFFTIIYSDEPLYGGFVCEYGDGQIAYSKMDINLSNDIKYNDESKINLNNYLIKDEDTQLEIIDIEGMRILSKDEIKPLIDFESLQIKENEIEISDPIINYYAQLENYPNYINRKNIVVKAMKDTTINYLVIKDDKCIGLIKYDSYYENKILEQIKTDEIRKDCKFIITTSGASFPYYLTGDREKDNSELNKYIRNANALFKAYEELAN